MNKKQSLRRRKLSRRVARTRRRPAPHRGTTMVADTAEQRLASLMLAAKQTESTTAATARRIVREVGGVSGLAAAADNARAYVDRVSAKRTDHLACQQGCAYCCHMPVAISAVEALTIAKTLRDASDTSIGGHFTARVLDTDARLQQLACGDYARSRIPCAFLDDNNRCAIYEQRPFACRGYTSTSSQECHEWYDGNDAKTIRMDPVVNVCAWSVGDGLSRGVRRGGVQRYELHSAVARAIEIGEDGAERWMTGDNMFADCRVPDRPLRLDDTRTVTLDVTSGCTARTSASACGQSCRSCTATDEVSATDNAATDNAATDNVATEKVPA